MVFVADGSMRDEVLKDDEVVMKWVWFREESRFCETEFCMWVRGTTKLVRADELFISGNLHILGICNLQINTSRSGRPLICYS